MEPDHVECGGELPYRRYIPVAKGQVEREPERPFTFKEKLVL